MSKKGSMRAARRAAWGHASDLLANYNLDRVIRPELESVHPSLQTSQRKTSSDTTPQSSQPQRPPRWQA